MSTAKPEFIAIIAFAEFSPRRPLIAVAIGASKLGRAYPQPDTASKLQIKES